MNTPDLKTYFAPPERANTEEINLHAVKFFDDTQLCHVLNAIPDPVIILNWARQIVYANQSFLEALEVPDIPSVLGLRTGEALDCIHSHEMEGGCGTSIFCRECGAAKATLKAQHGSASVEECRITKRKSHEAHEFRVWTTPFSQDNIPYTIFVIEDISNEKRRHALERIFFHDVLNTAGILRGYTEIFHEASPEELDRYIDTVQKLSDRLIEEIKSQRELVAAENNELTSSPTLIHADEFLGDLITSYRNQKISSLRHIDFQANVEATSFVSDRTLISRVVGNMIKNALEATREGETVCVGYTTSNDRISFWVRNPSFIPPAAQLQIFQRSFSTKGTGRGLGTYSMQMLSRRYLHGDVTFTSSKTEGTVFTGTYPLVWKNGNDGSV